MVDRSIAVSRACRLALTRWAEQTARPSGVVVLREPRRGWSPSAVAEVVGGPLITVVDCIPAVARAVDRCAIGHCPTRFARQLGRLGAWL
jgi:hypothetical protein